METLFALPGLLISAAAEHAAERDMTHLMTQYILQLAIILLAARMGGFLVKRYLNGPAALGELAAGMLIGPYALGAWSIPGWGPLFPPMAGIFPVSTELYALATLASIVLLFLSGLETDMRVFLHYSVAGVVVGTGGLLVSFFLGAWCALLFGVADSLMDPSALFMGAMATATSVSLPARILSEKRKMASPEGVTILAAAVFDDVLGIIALAIIVGMSKTMASGAGMDWGKILIVAAKSIGFWLVLMVAGLLLAKRITRVLKLLRSPNTIAAICFGLGLLLAGISEMAGLAMIIGAYIMGLSLSGTDLVYELQEQLRGVYDFVIPIFFCVMGMLVNFAAMKGLVFFGLVYTLMAVVSKVAGCGIPAWMMKFTPRGAFRIGAGMVPRAEVTLIVAGIGLSAGYIGPNLFGVAVMMAMLTTVVAPPMILLAFKGGPGVRGEESMQEEELSTAVLTFPSADMAEFICGRITRAFRGEEFFVHLLDSDIPTYQIRKEDMAFSIVQDDVHITLSMPVQYEHIGRFIVLEEVLALKDLLESAKNMQSPDQMGTDLVSNLFA